MDALIEAREQLLMALPIPPKSYKGRLITQMALSCILIVQCIVYLCTWVRDARRAGRSWSMFHIQRTQGGPILVTQALYSYVFCGLCEGIVQLVYRTQAYASYYKDVVPQNLGVLEMLTLTFGSLGILGYTFSNLNSTALLFRKSRMVESVGKTWVIFYDSLFIIALLGWIGGCFAIGVDFNSSRNIVSSSSKELHQLLDLIIADPSQMNLDVLGQLQTLQEKLTTASDLLLVRMRQLTAFGAVYSGFFALSSVISLMAVYRLRKHTRETRTLLEASGAAQTEYHSRNVDPWGAPQAETERAQTSTRTNARKDITSLERLVADLSLSVPMVLLVCLFYPIAGSIAVANRNAPGWAWAEFRNDLFVWPGVLVPNIIVGYFMFNRWRAPGRYGRTTADPTSLSDSNGPGSGSRQQRSFSDAHQLNALHAATNKYPPFVEGGKASDAVPVVLNGGYNKEFESGKENPW